jgi:two-component system sensor histidine kinase RegB
VSTQGLPFIVSEGLAGWLARFRLGAFLSELLLVVVVDRFTDISLPVFPLAGGLLYAVATNLLLRRPRPLSEWQVALVLTHDVLLLTVLLALSGGVHNPFSALYLVYVALAPVLLSGRWTAGLVAVSVACFAALFVVSGGVAMKPGSLGVDHATQMRIHMRGMWLAFTVAAVLIGVFVWRLRTSLDAQTRALELVRMRQARTDKLGALATLAASATHELGTPLGTIALVSRELERSLAGFPQLPEGLGSDATLIRAEVERCRGILERLSVEAGALRSGGVERVPLTALVAEACRELPPVEVSLAPPLEGWSVTLPSRALSMALRNLVKNGLDASHSPARVHLALSVRGAALRLEVQDTGDGMTPDQLRRATEPFFSTKAPGLGMGLGLFLAQAVAEQLDGHLELTSAPGVGTTAALEVPLTALRASGRPA